MPARPSHVEKIVEKEREADRRFALEREQHLGPLLLEDPRLKQRLVRDHLILHVLVGGKRPDEAEHRGNIPAGGKRMLKSPIVFPSFRFRAIKINRCSVFGMYPSRAQSASSASSCAAQPSAEKAGKRLRARRRVPNERRRIRKASGSVALVLEVDRKARAEKALHLVFEVEIRPFTSAAEHAPAAAGRRCRPPAR